MPDVKRMEPRFGWNAEPCMSFTPEGRFVHYSDYEKARREGAQEERERLQGAIKRLPQFEVAVSPQDSGVWVDRADLLAALDSPAPSEEDTRPMVEQRKGETLRRVTVHVEPDRVEEILDAVAPIVARSSLSLVEPPAPSKPEEGK